MDLFMENMDDFIVVAMQEGTIYIFFVFYIQQEIHPCIC